MTESAATGADAGGAVAARPRRAPKIRLVVLGARPEPVLEEPQDIVAITDVPSDVDDGATLDLVEEAVADDHLLALSPEWYDDRACRRLQTARALAGRGRVAIWQTRLPPLALGVLATLTSAVAPSMPSPGALVAAMPALESRLLWLAWLGSVTGLGEPSPSLLQHAASVLPGSTFAVSSWPEPAVHRLKRRQPPPGIDLPSLTGAHQLVVAGSGDGLAWMTGAVRRALGDPPLLELEATRYGTDWWSTRRLVEAVVHPTDVAALAAELRAGLTLRSCRWCGEMLGGELCPFCGMAEPT